MAMSMAQKILARASGRKEVTVGEIVEANVDMAMSHDDTWLVGETFEKIGAMQVWDRDRIVVVLDHRVPANTMEVAATHRYIRSIVKRYGITHYYGERRGICHQVMIESGHVWPGGLVVGADSHTTSYGALGALGTGIGASEMASVWATGKIWMKVPSSIRVNLTGQFREHSHPKDLILGIIGDVGADGATYKSVEFHGDGMHNMGIPGRITLSNMSMEMGAKAAMVPPDDITRRYVADRVKEPFREVHPDADADYARVLDYDADRIEPMIACPHRVDNVKPVEAVAGKAIDQAVLGSCTNGRVEDLERAADVLAGHVVHPDVRMLVVPASMEEYLKAVDNGTIRKLVKAGCLILNSGCGPCMGAHQGILALGETAITTTNRNFRGRMGAPEAEIYLASAETVAASALTGMITDPGGVSE